MIFSDNKSKYQSEFQTQKYSVFDIYKIKRKVQRFIQLVKSWPG